MKKGIKVLKELAIALGLIFAVAAVAVVVFIDKIPIAVEIPEPEVYASIDKNDFIVSTDGIENAVADTVVYQSTPLELANYGSELRYISGRAEPLTSGDYIAADIPKDIIGK